VSGCIKIGGHNFTYFSTLVGDVLVKFRHDVFAAVYGGRGAILVELRDAMTAEPGHIVFVDNFGMSRVVVIVVGGSEERFEVCHEKERDGVLLFHVGEFHLAIVRIGILDLLRWVLDRQECGFRERTSGRTGEDSCCMRELHRCVWICVPLNWTCWLRARNDVLWCLRAAEDLCGAVCLFRG